MNEEKKSFFRLLVHCISYGIANVCTAGSPNPICEFAHRKLPNVIYIFKKKAKVKAKQTQKSLIYLECSLYKENYVCLQGRQTLALSLAKLCSSCVCGAETVRCCKVVTQQRRAKKATRRTRLQRLSCEERRRRKKRLKYYIAF